MVFDYITKLAMRGVSMKFSNKKILFCIITTFLILILELCIIINKKYASSVSQENNTQKPILTFSHESGFYNDAFYLTLSAESGTIYYTLDGSDPTTDSLIYTEPIYIEDNSLSENKYASRTDTSVGFLKDRIDAYSPEYDYTGFTAPNYPVDKAVIIRAIVYENTDKKSDIVTKSYFIDYDSKEEYKGINILSIVTDPANLFDYNTGIYTTGATYDEYWKNLLELDEYTWIDTNWMWWPANYRNRGIEWEREATCQFFDTDGTLLLEQDCGIRIHGGFTRGQNPKSLNLYARKKYSNSDTFSYEFFDSGYFPSSMTLSIGGNDHITKMKDALYVSCLESDNVATLDYVPYIMFLDGEYWGVYLLTEKYDEEYLSYHYGVASNNVVIIKNGKLECGSETDYRLYENMYATCSTLDLTKPENYQKVCSLIDINSYIDYYASMIYIGRYNDWPSSNYALWRTIGTDNNNSYSDGKWRWLAFDLNSDGMSHEIASMDTLNYVIENDEIFRNLMTNDDFKQSFMNRLEKMRNVDFESNKVTTFINDYSSYMKNYIPNDQKRFYNSYQTEDYKNQIISINTFFSERNLSINSK